MLDSPELPWRLLIRLEKLRPTKSYASVGIVKIEAVFLIQDSGPLDVRLLADTEYMYL